MGNEESRVVHVKDNVPGAVYVGRAVGRQRMKGSVWGNPFTVRMHGRAGAIALYRNGIEVSGSIPLIGRVPELRGKPLACWCRHDGEDQSPDNACHGDVLVNLLDTYTDDELRLMATRRHMELL